MAASGSFAGTSKPDFPSSTEYFIPPTFEPMTGVPHAMDSRGVIPNGSYQGVVTKVALIGESGSGKSTLLALLRGLHDPLPGTSVTVDDKWPASLGHISSTVTLFPQEPEIFENTILYNLTLGLSFSREEVMKACDEAGFTDVLQKLPQGLDTMIQEKGVNLSGGQRQRLALARGILAAQNSEIILMDEPTSSVDPRTEKLIYANMFEAFKGKLIISSLHRLHLLTQFDYIYILRNGQVVDQGSFDDLNRYSLVFQEMWLHQRADVQPEHASYSQLTGS